MPRVFHEQEFTFQDGNALQGIVDLQVFRRDDEKVAAVISELISQDGTHANVGTSVTDGIEQIATAIVTQLGFVFDFLIEHYPAHGAKLDLARSTRQKSEMPERFHLVTLQWDNEANRFRVDRAGEAWAWKSISRREAEQIIGSSFRLDSR